MNTFKLSNIPVSDFRLFLFEMGCKRMRISGGHELWAKEGLSRPVVIQSHVDPVPEFIIRNILRDMHLTRKDFIDWLRLKRCNKKV